MATNIDERIVAAKFDASDFEKGVDKTLKKLDELKKSLDLKDATKGVKELAEKTEASTDSMSKSLEKLTERFTTFVGMIKQRILGGLADEVAGVFLRMEQSVTGFIRSISSDQVGAGMSKYEQMLTSVRMMMAAGESQSSAYYEIDKLREYSDQTSYSLSQMTDALSKMRAAGVDIDTARKSVEGIANACANAGVNATEAQRAFYNLSQAYAKGSLNYTDYKSLELLNMTTEKFKENMLEAAVEAGTLKKLSDGVYQTISTTDKKVKAGKKVTIKNATDMLKYDYMNNRAMNILFGKKFYFDETAFREYKKKWTDKNGVVDREKAIEEAKKDFGQIAVDSYLAAREARSFTDVINTLKDVVSTGWSTTFENLFGKLDEAVDFFTKLTEGDLAESIYRIGEWRNEVLETWNVLNAEGKGTGGELFRQTILNITDSLGILIQTFEDVLPDSESFGESLLNATYSIRDFSINVKESVSRFREWMNSPMFENGPTRIEKIRSILGNLAKVFGIVARVAGSVISAFGKMITPLGSVFDSMIGVDDIIVNLQMALEPVSKVLEKVVGFLGDVAAFFVSMAVDTFGANVSFISDLVGILMELFTGNSAQKLEDGEGVLGRIKNDFEGIKEACKTGLGAVKEFFGSLISDIRNLLGLTDESEKKAENQNGGIFSGLINFFNTNQFVQDAKKWVDQAIIDVGNFIKSIPSRVAEFGANIYDTLRKLFFKDESDKTDNKTETESILTPLGEWVNQAIIDIKEFFLSIPQRIIDGVGTVTNWIDEVFNYWFAEQKNTDNNVTSYKMENGEWKQTDTIFAFKFEQFIANAKISISKWFEDLPNKIRRAFSSIGNFVTNLYKSLDEFLFGKKVRQTISVADGKGGLKYKDITVRYKTGFSKWLDGVIKEIRKFIGNVPEYIKNGIKGVGDILSTIVNSIFGKPANEEVTSKDVTDSLKKPFLGIDLNSILTTIADIGKEIFNQVIRLFTGTDDLDKNTEWFSNKVAEGIRWIRVKAKEALDWVLEFIGNLPTTIANIFTKENKDNAEQGPVGQAVVDFGKAIGKFISEDLPNTVFTFINNATTEFDKIWTKLYTAITGEASEKTEEAVEESKEALEIDATSGAAPQLTSWQKFVKNLGETIAHIWEDLPVWIANGIEIAITEIDKLISNLGTWISGIGVQGAFTEEGKKVQENVTEEAEKFVADTTEGVAKSAEEGEDQEEPRLITAIKSVGERIKKLFMDTLPAFVQEAFTALGGLGSTIFNGLHAAFTGDIPQNERELAVANVGTAVIEFFKTDLPAWFTRAWETISTKASEIFEGFSAIFTGSEPQSEVGKSVKKFGDVIYNVITRDIPAAIKKAFDFIKGLFIKKDPVEENLKYLPDSERAYVSRYIDKMKKDTKKAVDDENKPNSWSFLDGIKEGFLNAFKSIGPAILNGLSTALNWIGDIVTIIIDAMTGKKSIGEQIDDAYKEENPELRDSLKRIGESLKNFFLDTIPKFIGAAIGTLQKEAPLWFAKLFGAMSSAAESEGDKAADKVTNSGEENAEKVVEGASGVLQVIMDLINNLKEFIGQNKDIMEIAIVLVTLTMLMGALRDLFSISEIGNSIAEPIKWTAIVLAITTIAGVLSYISTIVNSGDQSKIDNFNTILDKLSEMLKNVAGILALVTAGKFIDLISDIKGDKKEIASLTGGGGILGIFGDLFGGILKGAGFGAGAYLASVGVSASIDTLTATLVDSFTDLSSGLDSALQTLEPSIEKLEGLYDKLDTAKQSVIKIKDLFSVFMTIFEDLYSEATGNIMRETNNPDELEYETLDENNKRIAKGTNKTELSIDSYIHVLQERLELFMQLSVFINELSNAFNKMSNVEDISNQIDEFNSLLLQGKLTNFFVNVMNVLKTSIESSHLSPELLGSQYTARTSGIALALDLLADSMSVFAAGISNLNEDNVDAVSKMLDVFEELAEAFGEVDGITDKPFFSKLFTGDTSLSKIGNEIKLFGLDMKAFYKHVSQTVGFEENEIDKTNRIVDGMIAVLEKIATVAKNVTDYSAGFMLNDMNQYLPDFGKSLGTFFTNINDSLSKKISSDRLSNLTSMVGSISLVVQAMTELARISMDRDNFDITKMFDNMFLGISGYGNEMKREENINKISASLMVFNEGLTRALLSEDTIKNYEEVGSTLASRLITGIQLAIDSDPTLRITPVLNLDTAKSQIRELFGIEEMGNVDLSGLANAAKGANDSTETKIIDYTMQLSEINEGIAGLSRKLATVEDVGNAFSRISVVLDSGQLVGGLSDRIDGAIGEKLWLITRGNAVGIP